MDVLIIGYGKIGGIKSNLWRSLGRRVVVHDVSEEKIAKARSDGFEIYSTPDMLASDLIVDISTPATLHLESLKWALRNLGTLPRAILVEKPLASNIDELVAMEVLLSDETIAQKVVVNESYYLSTALRYVAGQLRNGRQTIRSICVELSKNRLNDVSAGRFTDPDLGTLGIELPHMLALLQGLGVDMGSVAIEKVDIFSRNDDKHNEGFRIRLQHEDTSIILESYLGDFRVESSDLLAPNTEVVRTLRVETDGPTYNVEFDPVPGLGRYQSRVEVSDDDKSRREVILNDNHLLEHLDGLHSRRIHEEHKLFSADNALNVAQFIFALKNQANHRIVDLASDVASRASD